MGRVRGGIAASLVAVALAASVGMSAGAEPAIGAGEHAATRLVAQAGAVKGDSELRHAYDAAFAAMLADPNNLDKAFAFAALAVKVGDLEGAVSALERMLLIDANLPRVRLELGVLYYRLGAFDVARTYLSTALAAPNIPPDVRQRAEAFLAEIDKQRSPSRLSGTLLAGLRYQSNANAAPTGDVRVGGIEVPLQGNFTARPDWNAFGILNVVHLYDLGDQHGDALDSRLLAYVARQFDRTDVDTTVVTLSSGPRLTLFPDAIGGLTFRPAVAFDLVMLHDRLDYVAPGIALALEQRLLDTAVSLLFDWRRRDYHNTNDDPTNNLRTGDSFAGQLTVERRLFDMLTLTLVGGAARYEAKTGFNAYDEFLIGAGLTTQIDFSPFVPGQQTTLALNALHLRSYYDSVDPTIDPTQKRRDRDWRVSLTANLPLTETISALLQGGYNSRHSSLPNYAYDNWFGLFGVAWRF